MSTLKTNTIQHLTSGFNNVIAHTDGAGTANAVHARAWVNFNGGASPITISAQFNVSSITDNGTGDYTVNFSNAMIDANYSAICSMDLQTIGGVKVTVGAKTYASGSVRLYIGTGNGTTNGTNVDSDLVCVSIFR